MPRRRKTTAMMLPEIGVGSRAFVYLRDSGGERQERSVEDQRAAVTAWTQARGIAVVDWFIDGATQSGD